MMSKLNGNKPMMSEQHSEACNGELHSSGVMMCIELIILIMTLRSAEKCFEVWVACWKLPFILRMMSKVNRNGPVMLKQHPSILSSFFPGHSRDVRTGQRDSAGK
jgi:hypothetical protein